MATLVFAHGGSFCKEIWAPIVRRLLASPVLRNAGISSECVAFDFRYHGSQRDESVKAEIDLSDPSFPVVNHPCRDLVRWSSAQALQEVRALQAAGHRTLIGVGHSMGAGALWKTEIEHPGTFAGLILFEPVLESPTPDVLKRLLVPMTLQRQSSWPSRAAAVAYFEGLKSLSSWDRESLVAYLKGALVTEADGSATLACHPHIEAAGYSSDLLRFSDEELQRAKCRVTFHSGERTNLFFRPTFDAMETQWPDIYAVREPMPKCSHVMVLENPELAAELIARDLAELPTYKSVSGGDESTSSRL